MVFRLRAPLPKRPGLFGLVVRVIIFVSAVGVGVATGQETGTSPSVNQFLTSHCVSCHGGDKPKANFRIDTLLKPASVDANLSAWKEILDRLDARDMPPKGKPRPTEAEYESATRSIRKGVESLETAAQAKAPRAIRRLTRREYSNAIRDLFGVDVHAGDDLPPDGTRNGFDTVADGQSVSAVQVEQYLKSARRVVDALVQDKPWPGLSHNFKWNSKENPEHFSCSPQWGWQFSNGQGMCWTFYPVGVSGGGVFSHPGVYRARWTFIPRNLKGGTGKVVVSGNMYEIHDYSGPFAPHLVASIADRKVSEHHIDPDQADKPMTIELTGFADAGLQPDLALDLRLWNGTPGNGGMLARNMVKPNNGGYDPPLSPEKVPANFPFLQLVGKTLEGPLEEFWPPSTVRAMLDAGRASNDPAKSLAVFLPRAFRRPVTAAEIKDYAALARAEMERGGSFTGGIRVALRAVLASPNFLYVVEAAPPDAPRGGYRLNGHELATRLSLFLASSAPDAALTEAAASGRFATPEGRAEQVDRLLKGPGARDFVTDFTSQWIGLSRLASAMPEPSLFLEFNPYDEYYNFYTSRLKASIAKEPLALATHVLAEDRPVTDFLAADYVVVDQPVAQLYGLPGVIGGRSRAVKLPDGSPRGGLLGTAAVLLLTSESTRTSPVIRGKWVLDRIFNRPPPPPPPAAGVIEPDTKAARSIRERIALHRAAPNCAGCHARFDPFGLALETFDAIGKGRTREPAWFDPARPQLVPPKGPDGKPATFPIDARAELPDGTIIDGPAGLKTYLLSRKDDFVRGLAEKLMVYAAGRGLTSADKADVDRVVARTKAQGYRFRALIRAVVETEMFLTR